MKNEEKSMIIDMAKNSIIPNAMSKLKNEVDKLTINTTKEELVCLLDMHILNFRIYI